MLKKQNTTKKERQLLMDRCFLCGRKMLNEVQCSNVKCSRHTLPKELQEEYDRRGDNDESEDKKVDE